MMMKGDEANVRPIIARGLMDVSKFVGKTPVARNIRSR
jgi:hypothetical protein